MHGLIRDWTSPHIANWFYDKAQLFSYSFHHVYMFQITMYSTSLIILAKNKTTWGLTKTTKTTWEKNVFRIIIYCVYLKLKVKKEKKLMKNT